MTAHCRLAAKREAKRARRHRRDTGVRHLHRMRRKLAALLAALSIFAAPGAAMAGPQYAWQHAGGEDTLEQRIAPPPGFTRTPAPEASWAAWLRGLPMKPAGAPVLIFTGAPKWRQDVHVGVVDIDVGKRDLQQCADAIMRLRGEWLFAAGRKGDIRFNDTQGKRLSFAARRGSDYAAFRKYMDYVFAYAGTYSLERELQPVPLGDIAAGDVFIKGGFPGHAVLVADMAENEATGERRFLLAQSYMPAQEIHVLRNPRASDGSPWYPAAFDGALVTPEWTFPAGSLRRWP
jgi:hypothetical protein